jgi:hypothetical protein
LCSFDSGSTTGETPPATPVEGDSDEGFGISGVFIPGVK